MSNAINLLQANSHTSTLLQRGLIKRHTKASSAKQSPYNVYLNSLAPGGRKPIQALLRQCLYLLDQNATLDTFQWETLRYEQVHEVRTTFLNAGYSVNSINLLMSALRGMVKVSFDMGHIDADTLQKINRVKLLKGDGKRKGRRLTIDEITKLTRACHQESKKEKSARDLAILLVGIGAGLRCAEICQLNWKDFDNDNGCLCINRGKGRKSRQIYLAPTILKALLNWKMICRNDNEAMFRRISVSGTVTNLRLTKSGIRHTLKQLQQSAGVDPFSPHDLRRTFITKLLEDNVDLNTVRQLAGHSDVSTTVKYDRRDEETQKVASQNLHF